MDGADDMMEGEEKTVKNERGGGTGETKEKGSERGEKNKNQRWNVLKGRDNKDFNAVKRAEQ